MLLGVLTSRIIGKFSALGSGPPDDSPRVGPAARLICLLGITRSRDLWVPALVGFQDNIVPAMVLGQFGKNIILKSCG